MRVLNKTKIEWSDYVWNPVTGCLHNCPYCYARKMANRLKGRFGYPADDPFKPTLHADKVPDRIADSKYGVNKKIFVCSMGDLFGKWVPRVWIVSVLDIVRQSPLHTFIFLTKNPIRYNEFDFPKNAWLGVTVESQDYIWRIKELLNSGNYRSKKFISFEPIQGKIDCDFVLYGSEPLIKIDWAIIGAESGNRLEKIIVRKEWVGHLLNQHADTQFFLKDNLGKMKYEFGNREQYPAEDA